MARSCAYLEKVFGPGDHVPTPTDSRIYPRIPAASACAGAWTLFATRRGRLNGLEQDLRLPARSRGLVGSPPPRVDSVGRIDEVMDSRPVRRLLGDIARRLKRDTVLTPCEGRYVAAVDGHEFVSGRKRRCPRCQTRAVTVEGSPVTEYYHQGVVCHRIGPDLASAPDVELLRPGAGEETAAKRLLERVSTDYRRVFDAVVGDALSFDAPFINSCPDHHEQVMVRAEGENRPLVQDAAGSFARRVPGRRVEEKGRRAVQFRDEEGFTSCEGVKPARRFLRTVEAQRKRGGSPESGKRLRRQRLGRGRRR